METTDHTERPPTGGDILVEVMRRNGIDTAFGVISIHNLPLVEAVARELNFVEMRHEAAAVNAADGYARASGKIGVAITSTGTGAGNAAGSMVEALTAGSRVLHVTGQIDSEYLGAGRGVIHEFPKQLQMLDSFSKTARSIRNAKEVRAELDSAIAEILAAPQGPASIEWPSDLQYLSRPDEQLASEFVEQRLPKVSAEDLSTAAAMIRSAQRPLIWAGGGAAGAVAELTDLVHRAGAGLLTSNSGRAIVPEDDPLVIGNFASAPEVTALIEQSDLLIAIGTHFRSNETKSYSLALPATIIAIDVDPAAVGRVYPATLGLVGDAAETLSALNAELPDAPTNEGWIAQITEVREAVRATLTDYIGGYGEICAGLRSVLPRESVVARDVTIPSSQWGNRLLPFYDRGANIFPLGGGIGQGLAMGIGAAHGRPESPTVVLAGDGGLSVHLGELASLAGSGAWCIVVVFNDGGYGVLRNMQEANGFDRAGVDLFTPRFDLLAQSVDMPYALINRGGQFERELADAVALRRPAMIEVDVTALDPTPGAFTPPVHIPVKES